MPLGQNGQKATFSDLILVEWGNRKPRLTGPKPVDINDETSFGQIVPHGGSPSTPPSLNSMGVSISSIILSENRQETK
jgi:hypothetical protein